MTHIVQPCPISHAGAATGSRGCSGRTARPCSAGSGGDIYFTMWHGGMSRRVCGVLCGRPPVRFGRLDSGSGSGPVPFRCRVRCACAALSVLLPCRGHVTVMVTVLYSLWLCGVARSAKWGGRERFQT